MRKSVVIMIIATVALTLSLAAGCGGGPETPAPAPAPSSGTPATPAPAPAEPVEVVYATSIEVKAMHPPESSDGQTQSIYRHIYDTLVYREDDGSIHPRLAESWETSADGLEWTFKLRPGVRYHDGTTLDAAAVKRSIEWMTDPDNAFAQRSLLNMVSDIVVVDDLTVKLVTEAPFGPLLHHLSLDFASIMCPAAIDKYGKEVRLNPVGTGPFTLKEWFPGQYIMLEKNTDFWGPEPKIDRIKVITVPEDGTRAAMLETGEIDVTYYVAPPDAKRLSELPNIIVPREPGIRSIYIVYNNLKPPFNDKRVRQALNYAVDKKSIVDNLCLGFATISDSPIPPGIWGHSSVGPYPHDVERAKQLLTEAGYPDGFKTSLWSPVGRYLMDVQASEAVVDMIGKAGVDATLIPKEFATLIAEMNVPPGESKFDMALLGWGVLTGDADYALYMCHHSECWAPTSYNRHFYGNPEVDRLLTEGRSTIDVTNRTAIYRQLQEIIWDDAPMLYLYISDLTPAYSARLKGVSTTQERVMLREAEVVSN